MMLSVVEEVEVSPSSSLSSRRRLRDGAGGGVYWLAFLMRDALGPCDGYRFFDFWIFDEDEDEEDSFEDGAAMKEIGLSNALLVAEGRTAAVVNVVERGRVLARRD